MDLEQEQPKLGGEEEEPYSLEQIPTIISTHDHAVSIDKAILQISDQGFTILQQLPGEQWLTIFTTFANTTCVGNDQSDLKIFVGDNEIEQEDEEPEIFKIIAAKNAANLNLTGGSFTVSLDLSSFGLNVVKEVSDILIRYMGEANERVSQYDEDEDLGEMISAEDIDEDGNILSSKKISSKKAEDCSQQWEEDEEEEK